MISSDDLAIPALKTWREHQTPLYLSLSGSGVGIVAKRVVLRSGPEDEALVVSSPDLEFKCRLTGCRLAFEDSPRSPCVRFKLRESVGFSLCRFSIMVG